MHRQKVQLLGPVLVVWEGGEPPRFRTQRTKALLGYLAAERRTVTRNALAALFWPDEEVAKGKANLRRELHNLGNILPGCWQSDRQTVQFAPDGGVRVDIYDLLLLQEAQNCSEAADLVRGEFLEGLYLDDNIEFETWLLGERERWRQRAERAYSQAVSEQLNAGDAAGALHFARRLLQLLPWHEAMHRQVMVLLAQQGQRDAALRQYEQCQALLQAELGVEVSAETRMLYERIRETSTFALHNIPAPTTPLIGREEELALLKGWLEGDSVRLITVTGAGGMGKTRLALGLAQQLLARPAHPFADGIYFISLASLQEPEHISSSIADVLKFPFQSHDNRRPPRQQLLDYLQGKRMLLILDNFEHLLDGAALLSDIVKVAPGVRLVATSRESLRLHGEQVLRLQGLGYYEAGDQDSDRSPSAAARLFLSAAERVRPRLRPDDEDYTRLDRICRLVQGMPLALELAATWTDTLSLAAIAAQIEEDLEFLASNTRGVPERHRSTFAVFDTSWQRLDSVEQWVFAGLSVFRGGFTREAAQAVASATPMVLSRLVSCSLLHYKREADRYEIHELLRQYAASKLTPDKAALVHRCHLSYFADHVERNQPWGNTVGQEAILDRLEAEFGNLAAALDWSLQDPYCSEQGLKLAAGLEYYWITRSHRFEGRKWLSQLLGATGEHIDRHVVARALRVAGRVEYFCGGDRATAISLCKESLALQERLSDQEERIRALCSLGQIEQYCLNLENATAYYGQGLDLAQKLNDRWGTCTALHGLGAVALEGQDMETAKSFLQRGLSLAKEIGDLRRTAHILMALGKVAMEETDWTAAQSLLQDGETLYRKTGHAIGLTSALTQMGELARCQADYESAADYYHESLVLRRELRSSLRTIGFQLFNLGQTYLLQGDTGRAVDHFRQCLFLGQQIDSRTVIALAVEAFANAASAQQDAERAAKLWGAAEMSREALGMRLHIPDRLAHECFVNLARKRTDESTFDAAWMEGREMSLDEAVENALDFLGRNWEKIGLESMEPVQK